MDPITVFEAGASALTLAEKLADLVEESREEEKVPRLTEINRFTARIRGGIVPGIR